MTFLCSCHSHTSLGRVLEVLVNKYQLFTGLGEHVLCDTWPLPHSEGIWMDTIHAFLHEISAQIHVANPWVVPTLWEGDSHIMDAVLNAMFLSDDDIQCINYCHLFLQVTTVSDITHHNGTVLIDEALSGTTHTDGSPILWDHI